ncbi:MAG: hypothetical protein U0903_09325 [Planctomycetales bacterium]
MAASKPTGLHYALIIFVMLTLIFGVIAFMNGRTISDNAAAVEKAKKEAADTKTDNQKLVQQIDALKKIIGHSFDKVVDPADAKSANTVSGAALADIAAAAAADGAPQASMSAAIRKLIEDNRKLAGERNSARQELDKEHATLLALQSEYQKRVDEQNKARAEAESTLQNRIQTADEVVKQKDTTIAELESKKKDVEESLDKEITQHNKDSKESQVRITNLNAVNNDLQKELQNTKKDSFEIPTGKIRSVDNDVQTVWINLGSADGLPLKTTFSVYTKSSSGTARGPEDIKGAIEVTQIIGPHLASARILKDDIYNPISPDDPIYTPLWYFGRKRAFSIVGKIDLDGDGRSDRELFHEMVNAAGATIDNEVDDDGNLKGDGISMNTKFLVIADVPSDPPGTSEESEERKNWKKIKENQKKLADEARERGVRVVTFNDFLNYLGYKPTHRIYHPGIENKGTGLRGGSVSKRTDGTSTDKVDSKNTYGMPDRRVRPRDIQIEVPGGRKFPK